MKEENLALQANVSYYIKKVYSYKNAMEEWY